MDGVLWCRRVLRATQYILTCIALHGETAGIFAFEHGIVERRGSKDRQLAYSTVKEVKLFEWYEHRFAEPATNVVIFPETGKDIRFSSLLSGDTRGVILCLRTNVARVEDIPFSA